MAQKPFPVAEFKFVFHPELDKNYVHFEVGKRHPFQPDPPGGMSRVNAWWLAEAALLAYWKPDQAVNIFRGAGFDCEPLDVGATNGYVASRLGSVLVAFRGTQPDEWQDILDDVEALPVRVASGKGEVHGGFNRALDRVWDGLEKKLRDVGQGRTVWFCGHSLGAALATLAAERYDKTHGVCTFGSPRVGDPQFVAAFNKRFAGRSWRFVHDHDVVTHLPPQKFFPTNFDHVDANRFIAATGIISTGESQMPDLFDGVFGNVESLLGLFQLAGREALAAPATLLDHMPKTYCVATWNDYDKHQPKNG